MDEYIEENRRHWEEASRFHPETEYYDVESFLEGETTLSSLEREELGDVTGKRMLHLQCHFGLDTLSWARAGAEVTGIDISTEAIETARELAAEVGLEDRARFVASDVYDLPEILDERYDVVFTSYGVLLWLPDIDRWAGIAAEFVAPGGTFYLVEFHPLTMTLPRDFDGGKALFEYPYFTPEEPLTIDRPGTYADEDAEMEHRTRYWWLHSVGEVVTALLDAGFDLEFVHEHPFIPATTWKAFPGLVEDEGFWRFETEIDIPLLLSVKARKPK